jgi:hypothetical protein
MGDLMRALANGSEGGFNWFGWVDWFSCANGEPVTFAVVEEVEIELAT